MSYKAPSAHTVARLTAEVMQAATFSACELGNFPLQASDVNCAFTEWAAGLECTHPAARLHPEWVQDCIARVRLNLVCLGFNF